MKHDSYPLLDFDAIEGEIERFAAGTDSESGDAQYNPDVWELRSRLKQMSGHAAALVADCRRKLAALVEAETERDRYAELLHGDPAWKVVGLAAAKKIADGELGIRDAAAAAHVSAVSMERAVLATTAMPSLYLSQFDGMAAWAGYRIVAVPVDGREP